MASANVTGIGRQSRLQDAGAKCSGNRADLDAAKRPGWAAEMFAEISEHHERLEALLRAIAHHAKRHDEHDPDLRQLVMIAMELASDPEHTSQCNRLKACLAAMEREGTPSGGMTMDTNTKATGRLLSQSQPLNMQDQLDASLAKAHAMAVSISGERFEGFLNMNDDLKNDYLWALADMIGSAHRAQDAINEHRWGERQATGGDDVRASVSQH